MTRRLRPLAAAALLAVAGVPTLSACGGEDEGDPAALKGDLLPAADVSGFELHRTFEWEDPIDFVVQGLPLPQSTLPSDAVEAVEDAGFKTGVGEEFDQGEGPHISVIVVETDSADGARDLRDYAYQEGLKPPCYGSCSEDVRPLAVTGIPDAKGVQLRPKQNRAPDAPPPFVAYGVGFTAGDRFYLVNGSGPPGSLGADVVLDAARKLHARVADGET